MIKLEVQHGKHKKKESGAKLGQPSKAESKEPDKSENKNKQQKKNNKKKQDKTNAIKQQPENPKEKNKAKNPEKDREEATIQRVQKQQQKAKLTISELLDYYKDNVGNVLKQNWHDASKENQIGKKLADLQKQKEWRRRKLQKLEKRSKARSEEKQQNAEEKANRRLEKIKERRKKKCEEKIKSLEAASQQREEKQLEYRDYYENVYLQKKPRFQHIENQYKKREEERLEEEKGQLMKRKQYYSPLDKDDLDNFQDDYYDKRQALEEQAQKKRQFNAEMLAVENEKLKKKFWKGEVHKRTKQEREQLLRQKNQPKVIRTKIKDYGTIVQSDLKEKIQRKKENEKQNATLPVIPPEEEDPESPYIKVQREKYFKGVNLGLVVEKRKKSLGHSEKIQKGNEYLQYLRQLPRAPQDESQSAKNTTQTPPLIRHRPETFKPKRIKDPYYRAVVSLDVPEKGQKIRKKQTYNYLIADMKAKHRRMDLEDKVIRYGNYNSVLEVEDRQNRLNQKLVGTVNDKLELLSRI